MKAQDPAYWEIAKSKYIDDMAGADVKGVTDNFRVMPELGLLDNVIT